MRFDGTLLAEYSSEIGMTKEGRDGFHFFVVHPVKLALTLLTCVLVSAIILRNVPAVPSMKHLTVSHQTGPGTVRAPASLTALQFETGRPG